MMRQFPTRGITYQLKGKHMLYTSEYSAGSNYYRTNDLSTILHLVSIFAILSLFLACNKIHLKHVLPAKTKNTNKIIILAAGVVAVASLRRQRPAWRQRGVSGGSSTAGSMAAVRQWQRPTNQLTDQSTNPLTNRPTNQLNDQPTGRPTDRLTDQLTNQPTNPLNNQLTG
jgi:hypothetical protein